MTEQMFPVGGGTALAEAPGPFQAPEDDSVAGDNRKKLLVVAVAAGLLVAVVAAYFLMKSGGSANTSGGFVPGAHHGLVGGTAANKGTSANPPAAKPVTLPRQVAAPEGRNPFKPLYVVPTAPAAGTSSSSTTQQSAGTAPATTTSSSSSSSSSSTAPTYHPVWIELRSVTSTAASFIVGYSNGKTLRSTSYSNVKAPVSGKTTVFASSFSLLSVHSGVATLRFGDGSPFALDMQRNYMVVD